MKSKLALACLIFNISVTASVAAEPADKCAACKLVTKAEMSAIMGELKGGETCDTGLRPTEVTCNYDNMAGQWVKIRLFKQTDDQFSSLKNLLPNKLTPVAGLGKDAFSTKEGTDSEVFARKNGMTLEVDSSGGMQFAKAVADKAYARLK
jgi:hypothetical protein